MLTTLPPSVKIYAALEATDLRRSVDGLSLLVRESLRLEPFSGHLFLFRNRRADRLKILVWDRSGFWVLYKRLERGTFAWPLGEGVGPLEMKAVDLMMLLSGVERGARRRRWYDRAS